MSDPSGTYFPPEILDFVIDLLRDEPQALKKCSLVSESWIPRTRKHLFATVKFQSSVDLEAWKGTFPDPAGSPAYNSRLLSVRCAESVTIAGAGEDG